MSIPLLYTTVLPYTDCYLWIMDYLPMYLFHMDFKSDFYVFCRVRVFHIQVTFIQKDLIMVSSFK